MRGEWAMALLALASCGPLMHEREGRRVFNPSYGFILESTSRDAWQKPEQVMDALGVGEGTHIADIGAGTGYFTERFSRRVGSTGQVYATDAQSEMVERLRDRVASEGLGNVSVVAAAFDDPALAPASCDVVFFSSVYKEIGNRERYLLGVAKALRPQGRVAILEYRPDADGPGPPRDLRMSEAQIIAELRRAGFVLKGRHTFIDRQSFLVFERAGG